MILNQADNVIFEGSEVSKIMLGDTLVYPESGISSILKARTIYYDSWSVPGDSEPFAAVTTSDCLTSIPIFLTLGDNAGEISAVLSGTYRNEFSLEKKSNDFFILTTSGHFNWYQAGQGHVADIEFTSAETGETVVVPINKSGYYCEYASRFFVGENGGRSIVKEIPAGGGSIVIPFYIKLEHGIINDANPHSLICYYKDWRGILTESLEASPELVHEDLAGRVCDDAIIANPVFTRDYNEITLTGTASPNTSGSPRFQLLYLKTYQIEYSTYALLYQPSLD